MHIRVFPVILVLNCLLSLMTGQAEAVGKIKKTIGPDGKAKYSDIIPPTDKDLGGAILNPRGIEVEKIERAKTILEREQDRRLKYLKAAEEKIIASQKKYDQALLNTYHSKADLMLAIEAKSRLYETQNQVLEGNLTRLKQALEVQQKSAAALERNAEPVPEKLLKDIKSSQKQIQELQNAINLQKEKQSLIKKADEADIARFLFLTQTHEIKPRVRIASIKEANELGLFYCENDINCNKAWEIGREFVNYYSTTPPDVFRENLIMNRPPATDTDISLSLSKIPLNEQDSQLFLDIHCRESSMGRELCGSQKIRDIRATFSPFVNDALSRAAQQ
jgi:hypothetical protein